MHSPLIRASVVPLHASSEPIHSPATDRTPQNVVVMKWGGGLITDKSTFCTARHDVISALAAALASILRTGTRVILVHGAGSFGHLRSRQWRLADGRLPISALRNVAVADGVGSQDEAFTRVQEEMQQLNDLVCAGLRRHGIRPVSFPPHTFATSLGPAFTGELPPLLRDPPTGMACVTTWGDPVVDPTQAFGILSGDDIVVRLCAEVAGVSRLVFAGAVDGILTHPPEHPSAQLVPVWAHGDPFHAEHNAPIDVTGGIGLKAERAAMVVTRAHGRIRCFIVNGHHPDRVIAAALRRTVVGTEVVSSGGRASFSRL